MIYLIKNQFINLISDIGLSDAITFVSLKITIAFTENIKLLNIELTNI